MAVNRVPSPPPPEVNTPVAENWCYTQVCDAYINTRRHEYSEFIIYYPYTKYVIINHTQSLKKKKNVSYSLARLYLHFSWELLPGAIGIIHSYAHLHSLVFPSCFGWQCAFVHSNGSIPFSARVHSRARHKMSYNARPLSRQSIKYANNKGPLFQWFSSVCVLECWNYNFAFSKFSLEIDIKNHFPITHTHTAFVLSTIYLCRVSFIPTLFNTFSTKLFINYLLEHFHKIIYPFYIAVLMNLLLDKEIFFNLKIQQFEN